MAIQKVLDSVLGKISLDLSREKEINKTAKEILVKLKKSGLKAEIGGSLAKGTLVKKKNQDVDIFLTLDEKNIDKFEKIVARTGLEYSVVHGSRDYLRVLKGDIAFEIIPVLKFKKPEQAKNITDFSLIHVKYIKAKISKKKKLADEIKLAKAFCHAQNCYGAESYIGGFSGYALKVLVCHYGSFEKFLKNILKDRIIDPARYFKNKSEIFREVNQNKLQAPVVLIDPTYKYRNVCAGLTKEVFEKFLNSAKSFLRDPSEEFFERKPFDLNRFIEDAKSANLTIYELEIKTSRQEGDIAGTKMKKFFSFIKRELERKEQQVISSDFLYEEGQESKAYLAIKENAEIEIVGPKEEMKKAAAEFKKVRGKVYVSKGFVCAKEKVSLEEIFKRQTFVAEGMDVGFEWKRI